MKGLTTALVSLSLLPPAHGAAPAVPGAGCLAGEGQTLVLLQRAHSASAQQN